MQCESPHTTTGDCTAGEGRRYNQKSHYIRCAFEVRGARFGVTLLPWCWCLFWLSGVWEAVCLSQHAPHPWLCNTVRYGMGAKTVKIPPSPSPRLCVATTVFAAQRTAPCIRRHRRYRTVSGKVRSRSKFARSKVEDATCNAAARSQNLQSARAADEGKCARDGTRLALTVLYTRGESERP